MACRKAIEFTPNLPDGYFNLGMALMRQTEFDEAAGAFKKASDLFSPKGSRAEQSRQMEQKCRQFILLNTRLQGLLQGTEKLASAAERVEFARLCHYKGLYAAAARCYGEAMTAQPKLAEIVTDSTLYDAACDAALAGNSQGADSDRLSDRDRETWRKQALSWLQQELVKWGKGTPGPGGIVRSDVQVRRSSPWHWQTDNDHRPGRRQIDALARLFGPGTRGVGKILVVGGFASFFRRVPELENRPYGSTATTKK